MSRVTVAPVQPSDATELIEGNKASRAHHAPWLESPCDQAAFDAWLAGLGDSNVGLVARETGSGALVGAVTIGQIVHGRFHSAYLGYYGLARSAGSGLMTEAVGAAARYAFETLELHRVEANIQPGNLRSIALVKRLGFRMEGYSPRYLFIDGEWRDHERWALLAEEFTPAP